MVNRSVAAGPSHVDEPVDHKLEELLVRPFTSTGSPVRIDGVQVGTLVGFADGGATPLVIYPGQPTTAAQPARATLDLHAAHVGRNAVLMFENGDPRRPIIVGCLHQPEASLTSTADGLLEVHADGQRVVVIAKEQMVLRCGKASITLSKEGKVIVQGTYLSTQSSGVLRIRGGSVQIN